MVSYVFQQKAKLHYLGKFLFEWQLWKFASTA